MPSASRSSYSSSGMICGVPRFFVIITHVVSPWALHIRMRGPSSLESCSQVVSSSGVALWRYPFANVLELTLRRRRVALTISRERWQWSEEPCDCSKLEACAETEGRPTAVAPAVGHLKAEHRVGRNYFRSHRAGVMPPKPPKPKPPCWRVICKSSFHRKVRHAAGFRDLNLRSTPVAGVVERALKIPRYRAERREVTRSLRAFALWAGALYARHSGGLRTRAPNSDAVYQASVLAQERHRCTL